MKKIVRYSEIIQQQTISQRKEIFKDEKINRNLILLRKQNLFLTKGDSLFKDKITKFNLYLKNTEVSAITKLIKRLLLQD
jgi:hypothetical protein